MLRHFWKLSTPVLAASLTLGISPGLAEDDVANQGGEDLISHRQIYDWSGFHIGAGVGFGGAVHDSGVELYNYESGGLAQILSILDLYSIGLGADFGGDGGFGTVEAGYDFQLNERFVIGVQADYARSSIDTEAGAFIGLCPPSVCTDNIGLNYELSAKDTWTVTGRVGYVANEHSLIYALGGYGETEMEAEATLAFGSSAIPLASYSYEREATTFGLGIESVIRGNWTAKMEYRYTSWDHSTDIDLSGIDPGLGVTFWDDSNIQTIRGVVSYRFGDNDTFTSDDSEMVDWTGFRVGAVAGMGVAKHNRGVELSDVFGGLAAGADLDLGAYGQIGSLEIGYDHQIKDQFVIGLQADYTLSNMETNASIFGDVCYESFTASCTGTVVDDRPDITYTLETGTSWSVSGRAGWLMNPATLLYGLVGYTHQEMEADFTLNSIPTDSMELLAYSYDRDGWTFGFGMETMLTDRLSAKLEYRNMSWDDSEDHDLGFADTALSEEILGTNIPRRPVLAFELI